MSIKTQFSGQTSVCVFCGRSTKIRVEGDADRAICRGCCKARNTDDLLDTESSCAEPMARKLNRRKKL